MTGPSSWDEIVDRLRSCDTVEEGRRVLNNYGLNRSELLSVATKLKLSRLEQLSKAKITDRILHQAITARRKYEGLRSGWQ